MSIPLRHRRTLHAYNDRFWPALIETVLFTAAGIVFIVIILNLEA